MRILSCSHRNSVTLAPPSSWLTEWARLSQICRARALLLRVGELATAQQQLPRCPGVMPQKPVQNIHSRFLPSGTRPLCPRLNVDVRVAQEGLDVDDLTAVVEDLHDWQPGGMRQRE